MLAASDCIYWTHDGEIMNFGVKHWEVYYSILLAGQPLLDHEKFVGWRLEAEKCYCTLKSDVYT